VDSSTVFAPRAHTQKAASAATRTEWPLAPYLRNAVLSTAAAAVLALGAPHPAAVAIPQTSACATEPCDGQDLSNKDLTQEFYTKGSLKGANFSNSDLSRVTLFGADLTNANMEGRTRSCPGNGETMRHDAIRCDGMNGWDGRMVVRWRVGVLGSRWIGLD
jgi:hypothetical protein